MSNIRTSLDRVAAQYGAQIIDVRIMRTDLPDGAPLNAAFESMRTARNQEALTIRAEGARRAQLITAQADADAAKVYAAAFGKDPQFYDFYRAMQSYRISFAPKPGNETNMVISPDNDYLRQFRGK
jgi:membrane protease subunit HflC